MSQPVSPIVDASVVRYFIGDLDLIKIDGIDHTWISSDLNGHVLAVKGSSPELKVSFTHDVYRNLVNRDRAVRFENFFSEGAARARNMVSWAPLSTLSERVARKTITYSDALDLFIRMREEATLRPRPDGRKVNTGDRALEWILPEIESELARRHREQAGRGGQSMIAIRLTCPRDFRRKLKTYIDAGCERRVLDDKSGGKSRRNRVRDIEELRIRREYQERVVSKHRKTIASARLEYIGAVKKLSEERVAQGLSKVQHVSRTTFDKGVAEIEVFRRELGRRDLGAARAAAGSMFRGLEVQYPLQRVELDEWKVDLMVLLVELRIFEKLTPKERKAVERVRLWASIAIDAATRCILSVKLHTRAPNHETAIAAVEMAMVDKSHISAAVEAVSPWIYHGQIREVYTDAGQHFMSHECRVAMLDAGVTHVFPVTGQPELRPYIERFFRTCSVRFLQWYGGQTFSDYLTKGSYDAEENASLDVEMFSRNFLRALVDIYHHTPHGGLAGETPDRCWKRLSNQYGVGQPLDSHRRRSAFGLNLFGTISSKGITFLGLSYQSQYLRQMRKKLGNARIRFRVDRMDLARISFWDGLRWHEAATRHDDFPPNTSIEIWIAVVRSKQREYADAAELTMSIVFQAIRDLSASGAEAMRRAGVTSEFVDKAYVARMEKSVFAATNLIDDTPGETFENPAPPTRSIADLTAGGRKPWRDGAARPGEVSPPDRPRYREEGDENEGSKEPPAWVSPSQSSTAGSADDVTFED